MQVARRVTGVTAAAVMLIHTAACSDAPEDPHAGATPSAASSPSTSEGPSKTASPPSASERASRAATRTLRHFYDVRNQLGQNPDEPLSRLGSVATSSELAAQENRFRTDRRKGLRQIGATTLAELTIQSVDLANSDPKAGVVPTVVIDACYDVSDVDVVDRTGKSIVEQGRPETGWIRYSVSNYEWDTDPTRAWRVAASESIEKAPCAAR